MGRDSGRGVVVGGWVEGGLGAVRSCWTVRRWSIPGHPESCLLNVGSVRSGSSSLQLTGCPPEGGPGRGQAAPSAGRAPAVPVCNGAHSERGAAGTWRAWVSL